MSAKIEDFDVEIDTNMKFDSNFIKEKIPTYTSEKLCEIIVCDRYFGSFNAFAVSCMEELADRRIKGDQFEFEKYIESSLKDLPKLDFSIPDIGNVMRQFAGKMIKK